VREGARTEGQGNRTLVARAPVVARRTITAPPEPARAATPTPLPAAAAVTTTAAPMPAQPAEPAPPPSTLGDETALMERALSALAAHDFDHARYWLIEHARRFPDGVLQSERARIRERLEREHSNK
jgi:hypothetical protein